MRIIAGEYGSRRLAVPRGLATRPTLERTRESLFSILAPALSDARVLDLFAGSGALGLEALSRGAALAVFCDNARDAVRALRENIHSLGTENRSRLLAMDYHKALHALQQEGALFDLVFMDPPYDMPVRTILDAVLQSSVLENRGIIILEQDGRGELNLPQGLSLARSKRYRDTRIDFIVASPEEQHENSHLSGQL